MAFESVFKSKNSTQHSRITKSHVMYLCEADIKNIKNLNFVHMKIDRKKRLLGFIFSENNPEKAFFKITHHKKYARINLKPTFKVLGIKLTKKFNIKEITENKGMYIIDLKNAK